MSDMEWGSDHIQFYSTLAKCGNEGLESMGDFLRATHLDKYSKNIRNDSSHRAQ